ncbi:VCBS domain-containing protein, partial [Psychromonas sp.]|uniref:VCBS domain-containing protein n=1 Tax=Psychromonas sp. TaxID=1884585 RepID=UPI003566F34B
STYTLTQAEVGKVITVAASYTDAEGTAESVASAATAMVSNINDAPGGSVTITGTASEDQTLTANNTLADEDGLGSISYQWQADGADIVGATASTYTLTQAEVGKVITVAASYTDGQGTAESVASAATAMVSNINDAPTVANSITGQTAIEDTAFNFQFGADSFNDLDGDSLTYTSDAAGWLSFDASSRTFSGTPVNADVGTTTVTVTASDGNGGSVSNSFDIVISNTNDVPVASDDSVTSEENTLLNGNVPAATDVDGTVVSYQLVANVNEGSLNFNTDGSYTFTPGTDFDDLAAGASRDVTFTYTATDNDSGVSAAQTITLTVTGTNDLPVASDDSVTSEENTLLSGNVPAATDVDGTVLSYQLVDNVSEGSLTFNADGSYTVTPGTDFDDLAAGASRDVTFTYTATDNNGGISAAQTITLTVTGSNDTAMITGDTLGEVSEDATTPTLSNSGTLTISDADSGEAVFQTTGITSSSSALGSLIITADGVWTYNVANADVQYLGEGECKVETFTVRSVDGTAHDVTVTITGTNDTPDIIVQSSQVTFIEGDAPVKLFPVVEINSVEAAEQLNALTIMVTQISDKGSEFVFIDGARIELATNASGKTDSFAYSLRYDAGSAFIELSGTGVSLDAFESILSSISYTNNSNSPTPGERTLTLISINESNSLDLSDWLIDLGVNSVVNVEEVDSAPVAESIEFNVLQGGVLEVTKNTLAVSDSDSSAEEIVYHVDTITNGYFTYADDLEQALSLFTQYEVDTGRIVFVHDGSSYAPSFALTVSDGSSSLAINANVNFQLKASEAVYLSDFESADIDIGRLDNNYKYEVSANQTPTENSGSDSLENNQENNQDTAQRALTKQATFKAVSDTGIDSQVNNQDIDQPAATKQAAFKTVIGDKNAGLSLLRENISSAEDNMLLLQSAGLVNELNNLENQAQLTLNMETILLGSGVAVSTGLSVGYVAWLVRSGIILTSVLSSMPAWRFIDPLPVLSSLISASGDQETLETIVTGDNNNNDKKGE